MDSSSRSFYNNTTGEKTERDGMVRFAQPVHSHVFLGVAYDRQCHEL